MAIIRGEITGKLSQLRHVAGDLAKVGSVSGRLSLYRGDVVYYDGPYEVTPNGETQILATAGKTLSDDVTVNPIPSYYGRISWNGSALMVY